MLAALLVMGVVAVSIHPTSCRHTQRTFLTRAKIAAGVQLVDELTTRRAISASSGLMPSRTGCDGCHQ